MVFIYLISSAVIAFDQRRLPIWETGFRVGLAILVMVTTPGIHWTATGIALVYIGWHQFAVINEYLQWTFPDTLNLVPGDPLTLGCADGRSVMVKFEHVSLQL